MGISPCWHNCWHCCALVGAMRSALNNLSETQPVAKPNAHNTFWPGVVKPRIAATAAITTSNTKSCFMTGTYGACGRLKLPWLSGGDFLTPQGGTRENIVYSRIGLARGRRAWCRSNSGPSCPGQAFGLRHCRSHRDGSRSIYERICSRHCENGQGRGRQISCVRWQNSSVGRCATCTTHHWSSIR